MNHTQIARVYNRREFSVAISLAIILVDKLILLLLFFFWITIVAQPKMVLDYSQKQEITEFPHTYLR